MSGGDKTGKPRGKFVPPGYESRLSAFMDVVRFGPTALPGATFLALLFHVERCPDALYRLTRPPALNPACSQSSSTPEPTRTRAARSSGDAWSSRDPAGA
jgi:hypothetical protein